MASNKKPSQSKVDGILSLVEVALVLPACRCDKEHIQERRGVFRGLNPLQINRMRIQDVC